MSIFEQAARLKLRFQTPLGYLSTEDLWDLPMTSTRGPNLDDLAVKLHREIQDSAPISFVDEVPKTNTTLQLRFDIVKHVIDVRKAEREAQLEASSKAVRHQRIMEIMNRKEDDELQSKSMDELRELLSKD